MLAITPADFQAAALTWITVASLLLTALITALLRVWPQVVDLKARIDSLHQRVDRQSERQLVQEQAINAVSLATTLPAPDDQSRQTGN